MKVPLLAIGALSLVLLACNTNESHSTSSNSGTGNRTGLTPQDQSESEADRTITQEIRKAVVANDSLSMNAKNAKIITINGTVQLRGQVDSQAEKQTIERIAKQTAGVRSVDNRLEIGSR